MRSRPPGHSSGSTARLSRQTLIFDADDTLWENNVHFEEAIVDFIALHGPAGRPAQEIRALLDACEHETIASHGYGTRSFERSLLACSLRLSPHSSPAERARQDTTIRGFARAVAGHAIELLTDVAETLSLLAERHRLILMTKGDAAEQQDKLARSGMQRHFAAVEVLPEKHEAAYRAVLAKYVLDSSATWMIGNSPRSDINPALAAGMHAVFLRHPHTWALEQQPLATARPPQRLMQLDGFRALTRYF